MPKLINLGNNIFSVIDDDSVFLNEFKWFFGCGYAVRTDNNNKKRIRLHQEVLGYVPKNMVVDHINGDSLDNRKENLRICHQKENSRNKNHLINNKTSVFKGVSLNKANTWTAQISTKEYGKIYLGSFATEIEAAEEYNKASDLYHKEFGASNTKILHNERFDYSNCAILARAKTIKHIVTYNVLSKDGLFFDTITDAARQLNVKNNTIIKACTDNLQIRKVKGKILYYGDKVTQTIEID
jgi:hypothetical protein